MKVHQYFQINQIIKFIIFCFCCYFRFIIFLRNFVLNPCFGFALGFWTILYFTDISDNIHSFDSNESRSISHLINVKLRNLPKLLKHVNETKSSASNILLLFSLFPINFVLYLKNYLLLFCYLNTSSIFFIGVIIYFISIMILQTFWCHKNVVTIF